MCFSKMTQRKLKMWIFSANLPLTGNKQKDGYFPWPSMFSVWQRQICVTFALLGAVFINKHAVLILCKFWPWWLDLEYAKTKTTVDHWMKKYQEKKRVFFFFMIWTGQSRFKISLLLFLFFFLLFFPFFAAVYQLS